MNPRWRRWRDAAYVVVVAAIAGLVAWWWPVLAGLWRQHALTFAGATALMALAMVVQARNFTSFLDQRTDLRLAQLAGVWGSTALLNYAGPFQPGVMARIAYLRLHGVDAGTALVATWRQLCASVWLALGFLALAFVAGESWLRPLALPCAALFAAGGLLWRAGPGLVAGLAGRLGLQRHAALLAKAMSGIDWSGMAGVAAQYAIGTLVLLWVYPRFGVELDIGQALALACAVYVSALFAVLPGNVGVLEAIYALGGHQLGMALHEGAALALLVRAAHVSACLLLLPLAHGALGRRG